MLSTLFASALTDFARDNPTSNPLDASIHGYVVVFWWAAAITFVGAVIAFFMMRSSAADLAEAGPDHQVAAGAH
ncbi:hypothetical protein [Aeromicrobium sp. UC242_57]|uniref:hypothetical protein n=1 Tax=Aeromicrobium sp. UC242_57 TaxID=3374624 RepID=UPI0037A25FEA